MCGFSLAPESPGTGPVTSVTADGQADRPSPGPHVGPSSTLKHFEDANDRAGTACMEAFSAEAASPQWILGCGEEGMTTGCTWLYACPCAPRRVGRILRSLGKACPLPGQWMGRRSLASTGVTGAAEGPRSWPIPSSPWITPVSSAGIPSFLCARAPIPGLLPSDCV